MSLTMEQLTASAEYQALITRRNKLIWPLLFLTVGAYVAFILLIAFAPAALGKPIGSGPVSVGIILGLALILFNFFITFLYVRSANKNIEPLIARVHTLKGE